MLEKLRVVFTIPELRQKIFLTLILLGVYRIGYWVPLPVIDQEQIAQVSGEGSFGDILSKVAVLSASQLQQATIFGLGIMPYISASIIFQLLGTVWKPLEELRKEGEAGRKKINEYTRYATVVLCLVQSTAYVWWYVMQFGLVDNDFRSIPGDPTTMYLSWQITCVLIMTCGTVFLMWLGEQIDEYGIGNGISLLIMAGIVAQMPGALSLLFQNAEFRLTGFTSTGIEVFIALAGLFVAVVLGVVFITLGQRRIPTQSAKHVRGRRVFGGTRQYLPLKINQAGVMPIIFASSLLLIPQFGFKFLGQSFKHPFFETLSDMFGSGQSLVYNIVYVAMIYFFCYFWTAITFNPKEMSENLKESGTFIPGYRPGKTTADYLEKVMVRITYVGAGFLSIVAIVPTIISAFLNVNPLVANFYGGTGLLIAVSVAFDLVQKIDSHLVMRNYRGLLE
ncbi:preprotein translocase subunit SecY [Pirellulaceae bacterium]|jgi:preprotein translocase subunit SecY|nr:preprotein translocase subunit SecY [Pirellulaceae bacterium]MDB4794115.1 preprotein translocase subunit SecY [Pirellulaceae bacterium]